MNLSLRLGTLLILAGMILGIALALGIVPYQLDDAYIPYRYARNLVNGEGLGFNPGRPPVEGFSSPLWLLLLVAGSFIFKTPALPAIGVLVGLAGYMLCFLALVARNNTEAEPGKPIPGPTYSFLVSMFLLSVLPSAVFYSCTGLESLLFIAGLLFFSRSVDKSIPLKWGLVSGFLAPWIRPEGSWFLVAMICQLLGKGEWKNIFRKKNFLLAGSVIAGQITLVAARLLIFGQFLPNTYYAKSPWLKAGWLYVTHTLGMDWAAAVLVISLLGALLGNRSHRGYFFAGLAWIPAAIFEGGDWMPAGRLLLPAFALLLLAIPGIIENRFYLRSSRNPNRHRLFGLLALLLTVAVMGLNLKTTLDLKKKARASLSNAVYLEQVLANWLNECQARSIGTIDIGRIGYVTHAEIVDLAGLTDKVIGRSPGIHLRKDFDLSYIFNQRTPDIIILRVTRPPEIYTDGRIVSQVKSAVENRVMRDRRFRESYRFLFALLPLHPEKPYTGKLVFGRIDFHIPPKALPPERIVYINPK
jgi:arabinofuranosyltransferase